MVVIIKMKGLPWEATARDIRKFYRGLDICEEDIHLAPSPEGKASGYAFACFQKDDEARKAMHRNGKFVGKRYIELILSSQTEMDKILKEGVRMRRDDFVDNKSGSALGDQNEKKSNGLRDSARNARGSSRRSRSRSPIRMSSSGDASRSRKDHSDTKHVNGARSSGVYDRSNGVSTTRSDLDRRAHEKDSRRRDSESRGGLSRSSARDREGRSSSRSDGARRESERRDSFGNNMRSRRESTGVEGSTWAIMTGLPYSVTEAEVLEFFKGLDVLNVHFMLHTSGTWAGKKNGTAYVQFRSVGDCIQGADRNRQFIRKRYVGVKRCSVEEVMVALDAKSTDAFIFQEPTLAGGNFPPDNTMYSLGSMNGDNQNLPSPDISINLNGVGINPTGSMPSQHNAGVGMEGPLTPIKQLAAGANISMNDISAGCVIGIRNLPSTVSAEEILDFFYGFPIIPDSIRIHYLAPGRSSGDAMVTLPTGGEALSAIEQLNNKPVGKRKVQLFLV